MCVCECMYIYIFSFKYVKETIKKIWLYYISIYINSNVRRYQYIKDKYINVFS